MKLARSLASAPKVGTPLALAIGTFDGVHLGHQRIFASMRELNCNLAVFTFSNHPLDILRPDAPVPYVNRWEQKVDLLESYGLDLCILQAFSQDMAGMSYKLFLDEIYNTLPFEHLFIGEGDALGHNREGTIEKIREYIQLMSAKLHVIPKLIINNEIVSSTRLRKCLAKGDFALYEKLTNRPFTVLVDSSVPFVDAKLLKPGKYTVTDGNTPFICFVTKEGNLEFSDTPPLVGKRYITFIKKGS